MSRPKIENMVARRFGYWLVESQADTKNEEIRWNCLCDCGRRYIIGGNILRSGGSSKCRYCRALLPDGLAARNSTLRGYQHAAKQRGFVWDLTDELFETLTQSPCFYCGQMRMNTAKGKVTAWMYNGIDRKDSSCGYTVENSVSCCGLCNRWKSVMSVDDFINHAKKISQNQES